MLKSAASFMTHGHDEGNSRLEASMIYCAIKILFINIIISTSIVVVGVLVVVVVVVVVAEVVIILVVIIVLVVCVLFSTKSLFGTFPQFCQPIQM